MKNDEDLIRETAVSGRILWGMSVVAVIMLAFVGFVVFVFYRSQKLKGIVV